MPAAVSMYPETCPLVSVVIPAYNGADFIATAIDSVVRQTYQPIEIFVVDDGSTDNTPKVLAPYIRDGAVRYLRQSNAGHGAARNAGVRAAQGHYVCFLDQDDWLEPDSIAPRVALYRRRPDLGMVFSDFRMAFAAAGEPAFTYAPSFLKRDRCIERLPRACVEQESEEGLIFNQSLFPEFVLGNLAWVGTVLLRKSVFSEIGLFDESLKWSPDYDFFVRVCRKHSVGYLPASTAVYRQHSGNMSLDEGRLNDDALQIRLRYLPPSYGIRGRARRRLQAVIAEGYFARGVELVGSNRHWTGARDIWRAATHQPDRLTYYVYLLFAAMPPRLVAFLRRLKQARLLRRSTASR